MQKTYFIQAGENGPIKIGRSKDVQSRLSQLQVGHYEELHILCETFLSSEQYTHDLFDEYRISPNGEWFEPGAELLAYIEKMNIANTHFPSAFTDEPDDLSRGGVENVFYEQYLLDLSILGMNKNMLLNKKCKSLRISKIEYVMNLIKKDMENEFNEIDERANSFQKMVQEASKKGEVLKIDCTK